MGVANYTKDYTAKYITYPQKVNKSTPTQMSFVRGFTAGSLMGKTPNLICVHVIPFLQWRVTGGSCYHGYYDVSKQ